MEKFDKDVLIQILIHDKVMTLASYCLNFDDWKQLGRRLEIADEDLDNIEEQSRQKEYRERVHQMMRIWRKKRPSECNLYVLLAALEEIERRYEAQQVIDELVKYGFLKHTQDNGKSETQGVVTQTDTSKPNTLLESVVTECFLDLAAVKWTTVKQIQYDSNSVLGRGPLGTTIFKGLFGETEVAVKQMDRFYSKMPLKHFANLSGPNAEHNNLLRCYGTEEDDRYIYMALQPCEGNLASYLSKIKSDKVFFGEILKRTDLLKQITNGLNFLHENGIVHENIKPENILLSDKGKSNRITVLISEFGVRKKGLGRKDNYTKSRNPGYTAYEVLQGDQYTFASDIFSLGCIYYYVVSDGKILFKDNRDALNYDPEFNELRADGKVMFVNHIKEMINRDPAKRPTCKQLLKSPVYYFEDL